MLRDTVLPESSRLLPLDLDAIADEIKQDQRWVQILKHLSVRRRERGGTTKFFQVRRAVNEKCGKSYITAELIVAFFDIFERAGAGKIVENEDSDPLFEWKTDFRTIVKPLFRLVSGKPLLSPYPKPQQSVPSPRVLPRLADPISPVPMPPASTEVTDPAYSSGQSAAAPIIVPADGVVLLHMRGVEFALDISKIPVNLLKLNRIL